MSFSLAETFQERKKKKSWDRLLKEHKKAKKEEKRGKKNKKNFNRNNTSNYSLETISHTHTEMWLFYHDDFDKYESSETESSSSSSSSSSSTDADERTCNILDDAGLDATSIREIR